MIKRFTIAELLQELRERPGGNIHALYKALHTSRSTYRKIEKGERELSLLMAIRLCDFYRIQLPEFIGLLSEDELCRKDWSCIRIERVKARNAALRSKAVALKMKGLRRS